MTDWRDRLRELGFGNQSVIVGTKRRELFDEIEKLFVERQKVLELIGEDEPDYWQGGKSGSEIHATVDLYAKQRNQFRAELRQQIKR